MLDADRWQVANFGVGAPNAGRNDDFDFDSLDNLLEFAFGTNPASGSSGLQSLDYSGSFAGNGSILRTGLPILRLEPVPTGVDNRILFVRRKDYVAAGLVYTPQYSSDLVTWVNGNSSAAVLADDGTLQIASLPYLNFILGRRVRFFRLAVSLTP